MSYLPTITGTGRLVEDPELKFAASGNAWVQFRLAFSERKFNKDTQEWQDGEKFFVRAKAFRQLAENIAESLAKGIEVIVTGRISTQQWEKDGEKRSAPELMIDSIGPSLRFAQAKVMKADRSGGQASTRATSDDPWASAPPSDEPPF